jgi:DNA-binding GntR family transcriptional regulator
MVCADEMRTRDRYRELTEEQNLGYEEHLAIIDTLNAEQSAAFNEILHHVIKGKGWVLFVNDPGGTRKTSI